MAAFESWRLTEDAEGTYQPDAVARTLEYGFSQAVLVSGRRNGGFEK